MGIRHSGELFSCALPAPSPRRMSRPSPVAGSLLISTVIDPSPTHHRAPRRGLDTGATAALTLLSDMIGSLDAQLAALSRERVLWASEPELAAGLDAQGRALHEEKFELERALAHAMTGLRDARA